MKPKHVRTSRRKPLSGKSTTPPRAEDNRDAALADAIGAAAATAAIEVPPIPRLIADDCTPEAAASLLAEHGGRLAIISAEGGIFDIIAGRYSQSLNMDLWLKGHSGDPLRVDRKSRAPEYIPKPALSLGLVIQPQVLYSIAAAFVSFCGFCGLLRVPRPHCRPLATPPTR